MGFARPRRAQSGRADAPDLARCPRSSAEPRTLLVSHRCVSSRGDRERRGQARLAPAPTNGGRTPVSAGTKTGDHPVDIAQALGPRLAAGAAERDRDRVFPYEQIAELKESGLCGLWVSPEVGGLGGDARDLVRVLVALAEGDPSVAQMYLIHMYGVALIKGVRCPEELRERYYRRLVDEGLFITNAFSETSGKTVFDYSVTFEPTDSGTWRISGRKSYCTGSLGRGRVLRARCLSGRSGAGLSGGARRGRHGWSHGATTIGPVWGSARRRRERLRSTTSGYRPSCASTSSTSTRRRASSEASVNACSAQSSPASPRAALSDACAYVRTRSRPWPHAGVERAWDDPYVLHAIGRMQTLVSAAETMVERAVDVRLEAILRPQPPDARPGLGRGVGGKDRMRTDRTSMSQSCCSRSAAPVPCSRSSASTVTGGTPAPSRCMTPRPTSSG